MLLLLCLSSDRDQMSFFSSYMGGFAYFDAMRIHSAYCKAIAVSSTIREVMPLNWKISQIYDCFGEISFCILSQAQFERFLVFPWIIKGNNQEKNRIFHGKNLLSVHSFIKTDCYSDKEKINNLLRMLLIVLWFCFVEHNFKAPETNEVGYRYFFS